MPRNALRASCERSAFSIQLLSGMKSLRRAKTMEAQRAARKLTAVSLQHSAFERQFAAARIEQNRRSVQRIWRAQRAACKLSAVSLQHPA
jgi:hypothetical protein